MFGCDYYCTFCIVPFTRGKMQSRPKEQIIKEIQDLAQKGYKEIILLGQTVNAYGIDLKNSYDFADLLYDVSLIDGIKWIRFTSPYPTNFNDKQIKTICTIDKIAKHVHLPLQSGNNEILRRMARRYTVQQFLEVVYKFRELCPNIALSTDIIVGFPYETDEQFQDTLNIVKQVRFDQAFMFAYSEREGTKAATYPQLPLKERLKRLYELISVQNEITIEKNREYVGKELEILVEGESDKNPNKLEGRTETNKIVVFDKIEKDLVGKFVKVRITKSYLWGLEGVLLNSD
jgi:tRNA-2-methylthio-N6-dimethylallyladenosine synthase